MTVWSMSVWSRTAAYGTGSGGMDGTAYGGQDGTLDASGQVGAAYGCPVSLGV